MPRLALLSQPPALLNKLDRTGLTSWTTTRARAATPHAHPTHAPRPPTRVMSSDFSVIAADLFPLPHRCPNSFHNLTGHLLRGVSDCPFRVLVVPVCARHDSIQGRWVSHHRDHVLQATW